MQQRMVDTNVDIEHTATTQALRQFASTNPVICVPYINGMKGVMEEI